MDKFRQYLLSHGARAESSRGLASHADWIEGSFLRDDESLVAVEEAIAKAVHQVDPLGRPRVSPAREVFAHILCKELKTPTFCTEWAPFRQGVVDDALEQKSEAFVEALAHAGLSADVVTLLQTWMSVQLQAREMQQKAQMSRWLGFLMSHVETAKLGSPGRMHAMLSEDPMRSLSATELGSELGNLGDETVRQRERAGELFSVLRPGRKRGREYPALQAWPGIAGAPLQQILTALAGLSSTDLYGFFASSTDLLGGLTPVETLVGRLAHQRTLDDETRELLGAAMPTRLEAVIKAAEALAAMRAA